MNTTMSENDRWTDDAVQSVLNMFDLLIALLITSNMWLPRGCKDAKWNKFSKIIEKMFILTTLHWAETDLLYLLGLVSGFWTRMCSLNWRMRRHPDAFLRSSLLSFYQSICILYCCISYNKYIPVRYHSSTVAGYYSFDIKKRISHHLTDFQR